MKPNREEAHYQSRLGTPIAAKLLAAAFILFRPNAGR
jgi:hypothetical protein